MRTRTRSLHMSETSVAWWCCLFERARSHFFSFIMPSPNAAKDFDWSAQRIDMSDIEAELKSLNVGYSAGGASAGGRVENNAILFFFSFFRCIVIAFAQLKHTTCARTMTMTTMRRFFMLAVTDRARLAVLCILNARLTLLVAFSLFLFGSVVSSSVLHSNLCVACM